MRWLRLITCLWLVGVGSAAGAAIKNDGAPAPQGVQAVSNLTLSLELPTDRWVSGTPFFVKVSLRNDGVDDVEVPTTVSQSEFEYRFVSVELNVARVLSANAARLARRSERAPFMRDGMPLAPGASIQYTENLGKFVTEPLLPGPYQVTLRWPRGPAGGLQAQPQALQVISPKIVLMQTAVDTTPSLVAIWAIESPLGTRLLMREGWPDNPELGAAHDMGLQGAMPSLATTGALAVAIDARDERGARWHGWLAGSTLHAGTAKGLAGFEAAAPVALPLANPRLYPVAWPAADGAIFLALGQGADGQPALASATLQVEAGQVTPAARLAVGPGVTRWAAQRAFGDEGGCFTVVTVVAGNFGDRIDCQVLADGGGAQAPQRLCERDERVECLEMAPLAAAGAQPPFVDALFGPSGNPPRMTFLRLPLDGTPPLIQIPVPVPSDASGQPATDWALAPTDASPPRLVARLGGQIIGKFLSAGGRGFVLARDAAGAQDLRLEQVGDAWWAVWIDPALGLRYARLPDLA